MIIVKIKSDKLALLVHFKNSNFQWVAAHVRFASSQVLESIEGNGYY